MLSLRSARVVGLLVIVITACSAVTTLARSNLLSLAAARPALVATTGALNPNQEPTPSPMPSNTAEPPNAPVGIDAVRDGEFVTASWYADETTQLFTVTPGSLLQMSATNPFPFEVGEVGQGYSALLQVPQESNHLVIQSQSDSGELSEITSSSQVVITQSQKQHVNQSALSTWLQWDSVGFSVEELGGVDTLEYEIVYGHWVGDELITEALVGLVPIAQQQSSVSLQRYLGTCSGGESDCVAYQPESVMLSVKAMAGGIVTQHWDVMF